jgi:hypothetical protein
VGTAVLEDRHAEAGRAVEDRHADVPGAGIVVDGLALGGDEGLGARGVGAAVGLLAHHHHEIATAVQGHEGLRGGWVAFDRSDG